MSDTEAIFLGVGWAFPPAFRKPSAGEITAMSSAEEDIRQSLIILLNTRPGERVMHPSYGCGIHSKVFDVINESAIAEIVDLIERAVLHFEPRITLEQVEVESLDELNGVLSLRLEYSVRMTNTRSNIVYPFYTLEGTNVSV